MRYFLRYLIEHDTDEKTRDSVIKTNFTCHSLHKFARFIFRVHKTTSDWCLSMQCCYTIVLLPSSIICLSTTKKEVKTIWLRRRHLLTFFLLLILRKVWMRRQHWCCSWLKRNLLYYTKHIEDDERTRAPTNQGVWLSKKKCVKHCKKTQAKWGIDILQAKWRGTNFGKLSGLTSPGAYFDKPNGAGYCRPTGPLRRSVDFGGQVFNLVPRTP